MHISDRSALRKAPACLVYRFDSDEGRFLTGTLCGIPSAEIVARLAISFFSKETPFGTCELWHIRSSQSAERLRYSTIGRDGCEEEPGLRGGF